MVKIEANRDLYFLRRRVLSKKKSKMRKTASIHSLLLIACSRKTQKILLVKVSSKVKVLAQKCQSQNHSIGQKMVVPIL